MSPRQAAWCTTFRAAAWRDFLYFLAGLPEPCLAPPGILLAPGPPWGFPESESLFTPGNLTVDQVLVLACLVAACRHSYSHSCRTAQNLSAGLHPHHRTFAETYGHHTDGDTAYLGRELFDFYRCDYNQLLSCCHTLVHQRVLWRLEKLVPLHCSHALDNTDCEPCDCCQFSYASGFVARSLVSNCSRS